MQWTNRGARAEFFGKFPSGGLLWIIVTIYFALRNRPCAIVLLAPERTAGVDEQDLEAASTFAVGQDARAQHKSSGLRFLRCPVLTSFLIAFIPGGVDKATPSARALGSGIAAGQCCLNI